MKVVNLDVDCIAVYFAGKPYPTPLKIRVKDKWGEEKVIRLDKVIVSYDEKKAGNRVRIYACQTINRYKKEIKPLEVRFDRESQKWTLYKI